MKSTIQKTLIIASLLLCITGCKQEYIHVDKQEQVTSLDFTKYQKNNFLITPGNYGNDYESLGMFSFTVYPKADYLVELEEDGTKHGKWKQDTVLSQEVLDLAYTTAVKKGADAITHFKIKNINKEKFDGIRNFNITGIEISGLLIKRKL